MGDLDILNYDFPRSEQGIIVVPIADVHLGSIECNEKAWHQFCLDIAHQNNVYLMLVGDLLDTGLKTSKTDSYQQRYTPAQQCRKMTEMLTPLRDRILCAVEGNHECRVLRDTAYSPTLQMLMKLDLEERYRESMAFVSCRFGRELRNRNGKARPSYNLVALHGAAKTRNASLGYAIEGADVLITGHTHDPFVHAKQRAKIDNANGRVVFSDFYHISTSSWLTWGGYGMRNAYMPQPSCKPQKIHLSGNKKEMSITS